ncbi:MAG: hypothetical protein QXW98_06745 [Candidatus Caldarchaeum sp.]
MYVVDKFLTKRDVASLLVNYGIGFLIGMVGVIIKENDDQYILFPIADIGDFLKLDDKEFLTVWLTEKAARRASHQYVLFGNVPSYRPMLPHPLMDYVRRVN